MRIAFIVRRVTEGLLGVYSRKGQKISLGGDGRHSAEPDGGREVEQKYAHSGRATVGLCWLSF